MATEAGSPRPSHRLVRRFARLVTRPLLGSSIGFGVSCFLPGLAGAQEAAVAPQTAPVSEPGPAEAGAPTDVVHEVTVRGNKAEALKRASGSGTTIGEREIKNAQ